jgi:membrane-associated phospholipid phosphatase
MTDPAVAPPVILRAGLVVVGVGLWHLSQALLRYRPDGTGVLGDGIHVLTARLNRFLNANPRWANALLIVSSLGIDLLSCFVLAYSILGPSFRPFIGLLMLFFLRQVCQALSALPPPQGMIWRSPGVPSLLVTYGVSNDLFFSGHTALAVFGCIELGLWGGPIWGAVGVLIAVFEVTTVLVLRAHYTLDVFAGAVTAFAAAVVATWIAPACDQWLVELGQRIGLG